VFPPPQHDDLVRFSIMTTVKLRVPVLTMVLAATAVPVAFRPPQWVDLHLFSISPYDIPQNIAGFVPVGIVLAALGPAWAVTVVALLSMFAEASQLVIPRTFPDGYWELRPRGNPGGYCAARYNIKLEFKATFRPAVWLPSGSLSGYP